MDMDIQKLKQPKTWGVAIPFILTIWALISTFSMMNARTQAQNQIQNTQKIWEESNSIVTILKKAGQDDTGDITLQGSFDRVGSVLQSAKHALIVESKVERVESSSPKIQKDGSLLYRETYNLKNVKLLQIAKFIDYAERSFSSTSCTHITIIPSRNMRQDSWDANITFQYIKSS
ncbi:MAG: hypothetical protein JW860_10670 [Sedimentisphaerales bacterium]|nr:hypothetical protein [Sedimentisphaerales bacterium]